MVGGFVHAQERSRPDQHLRERHARLLATGEHRDALVHRVPAEEERARIVRRRPVGASGSACSSSSRTVRVRSRASSWCWA